MNALGSIISNLMQKSTPVMNPADGKPVQQRTILLSWKSPQRLFTPLDKRRYMYVLACVVALCVVLLLLGQYWFMAAILAVMFFMYVMGTIPPVDVDHIVTNIGIETAGAVYVWEYLIDYWFSRREGQLILNVDTSLSFPGRIIMLVSDKDFSRVNEVFKGKLLYKDLRKQGRLSVIIDGAWVDMFGAADGKKG